MKGERMDFLDFQRTMADRIEDEGFQEEDLASEIRKLKILKFDIDKKGVNIVSQYDGTIVFIDPKYNGEQVNRGDIWLCSVYSFSTVYNAMPLKKMTASSILGLDEGLRRSMEESLWRTNRREFEEIFKERYSAEIYSRAYNEAKEKYEAQLRERDQRIAELEKELGQSRYMMQMRGPSVQNDGIQLRSDDEVDYVFDEKMEKEIIQNKIMQFHQEIVPVFQWTDNYSAPGVPEMRVLDDSRRNFVNYRFDIERVAPDTLKCDGFPDGKYFAHISPRKNILVLRKHDFGSALCIDGRIRLEGLGELVPFKEREKLASEYNRKYDGVLIHI